MRNALRQISWYEWDGHGYEPTSGDFVYFTYGNIDVTRYAHARELAQTLQRDGIVDSLYDGLQLLSVGKIIHGLVTFVGEDIWLTAYDPEGEYEEITDPEPGTWVEFSLGNN